MLSKIKYSENFVQQDLCWIVVRRLFVCHCRVNQKQLHCFNHLTDSEETIINYRINWWHSCWSFPFPCTTIGASRSYACRRGDSMIQFSADFKKLDAGENIFFHNDFKNSNLIYGRSSVCYWNVQDGAWPVLEIQIQFLWWQHVRHLGIRKNCNIIGILFLHFCYKFSLL